MNKKQSKQTSWLRKGIAVPTVWIAVMLGFGGCYLSEEWVDIEPVTVDHALSTHGSCGSFTEYAKASAIQLMRAQVERSRDADAEASRNQGGGWGSDVAVNESAPPEAGGADGDSDADGDTGSGHSETNVQEQGVDEADLVKTDGEYIYALHLGELVIVEASAEGRLSEAGRTDVGGYADELFIYGDLAVVFSTLYEQEVPEELHYKTDDNFNDWNDCWGEWCHGTQRFAQIAFVDITDRGAPKTIRNIIYAGQYETSRRIDNAVRLVVHSPIPALEMDWYYEEDNGDWWDSASSVNKHYKKVIEKNEDKFNALSLDDIMPKKIDSVDGEVTNIAACENMLGPGTPAGIGLTTVISIDLDSPNSPESAVAVFGAKGLVYASTSSLYLTTSRQYVVEAFNSGLWTEQTSGVHKFDLTRSDSAADYLATGAVPGRMLDQFCLGEKDKYLRIATTTGESWNREELENHVYVLAEQGKELATVGHLGGLGKGEEIYAARFIGDRGFMVTFYQTDPLYTLDLSDPTNPRAVGEWHGPGYSTYLHPVGDNHILSVGLHDWRVAVSLYDITDFSDPTLVTRLLFPNDGYSSVATSSHKALTFNPETGFLALPYYTYNSYDTGIYTYDVQETGIEQVGQLQLNGGNGVDEGQALRSVYIDENLYGISRCRITSGWLDDPSPAIDTLSLSTIGSCDDNGNQWYGEDW